MSRVNGDIRLVCPGCGLGFPAAAGLTDLAARQAWLAAIGTPDKPGLPEPVLRRLIGYLSLQAPAGRAAQWPKVTRLIEELVALVSQPAHRRDGGPERLIRPEHWASALDQADEQARSGKLALPLDGHGWLLTVAYREAARGQETAARQAENRARGVTPVGLHPSFAAYRPAAPAPRNETGRQAALTSVSDLLNQLKPGT